MTAQDCLNILREIKDVAFATVDEKGLPQVRIIDVMKVGEESLYFCTARGKDFYRQLVTSRQLAVTGMNHNYQTVRLSGEAERLEQQREWIDRIFEENPSMKAVYPGESRYILEAFCITNGQIEFFDLGREPIYRESFSFGNRKKEEKGFWINGSCIGCGACKSNCPQQCMEQAEPYIIHKESCLHCGLCYEVCPVHAIERMRE